VAVRWFFGFSACHYLHSTINGMWNICETMFTFLITTETNCDQICPCECTIHQLLTVQETKTLILLQHVFV